MTNGDEVKDDDEVTVTCIERFMTNEEMAELFSRMFGRKVEPHEVGFKWRTFGVKREDEKS